MVLSAAALLAAGAIPAMATQGHQTGGTSSASCNDGVVSASPAVLWPPNHKFQDITLSYTDNDNDGDTIQITDVQESMADVNGKVGANGESLGAGGPQHDPDYVAPALPSPEAKDPGTTSTVAEVRSERSGTTGNGSGRVYSFTVTCHDSGGSDPTEMAGESDMATVFVCVPHDMSAASRAFCDDQISQNNP